MLILFSTGELQHTVLYNCRTPYTLYSSGLYSGMFLTSLEHTINLVLHREKHRLSDFSHDHMVNKQANQFLSQMFRLQLSHCLCSIRQQLPIVTSFWLLPTVILFGLLQISFCFLLYPELFLFNRCPVPFYLFENRFYPLSKIFLQQIYFGVMFISELPQFGSTLLLEKFFNDTDDFFLYTHSISNSTCGTLCFC